MEKKEIIKGYKGFGPDLKCMNFQYEVEKEYDTEKAVCCKTGFHFCENPLDVLTYYAPSEKNGLTRFCEVEGSGYFDKSENNKIACTHIKIIHEIGFQELTTAGIKFILDKANSDNNDIVETENCSLASNNRKYSSAENIGTSSAAVNFGVYSAAINTGAGSVAANTGSISASDNTGCYSTATNTGYSSVSRNSGYRSAATNTGDRSVAENLGDRSVAANSGNYSIAINVGGKSVSANTGYLSAAKNTGKDSIAANSGDLSEASVEGEDSVAIVTGINSKAKGKLGCWIVLTERTYHNRRSCAIKNIKAFKVDGKFIKEDTYYKLVDDEPVEMD